VSLLQCLLVLRNDLFWRTLGLGGGDVTSEVLHGLYERIYSLWR
jgi:hypothetical protein